jgi:ribonucleoside-diphosphate reductase beta chain
MQNEHSVPTQSAFVSPIFQERAVYKPFQYPWAYELWKDQEQAHWMADDVPSWREDIDDWNGRLTNDEKHLLTQIFRFFTQGDIDVSGAYRKEYLPLFHHPELAMMILSFANAETIHIDAYSKLIETVGMPETEYSAFLNYKQMADKHEFVWQQKDLGDPVKNLAYQIAKFSAFTEGLQLYSSFAILKSFELVNKMKGMSQIVTWSVRDESIHVEGMIRIFKEICQENPHVLDEQLREELYDLARKMVELEFNFIDLAFSQGVNVGVGRGGEVTSTLPIREIELDWIKKEDVKKFVEYTANRRLLQLGLDPIFETKENPFLWFDFLVSGIEHTNFFEQRGAEYQKVELKEEEGMEW